MSYTITTVLNGTVGTEVNITVEASDHISCTGTTCKYCIKNFTVMSASTYSLYITANDLLSNGYIERKTCTDRPISKKSNVKHKVIEFKLLHAGFKNNRIQFDTKNMFTSAKSILSQPLLHFKGSYT